MLEAIGSSGCPGLKGGLRSSREPWKELGLKGHVDSVIKGTLCLRACVWSWLGGRDLDLTGKVGELSHL